MSIVSGFVALFGSYRTKIAFDVVPRRHYAYCAMAAADLAKEHGLDSVTIVEFGVADGDGLLNLCEIARRVSSITGVRIDVVGFDTGCGMPAPRDYRDHPDLYQAGDFPMDVDALRRALPFNGQLVLGELAETVPLFMRQLSPESPLGFAAIDVDYYSSAVEALNLFRDQESQKYLPTTLVYLDDIIDISNSRFTGELLAVEEFNASNPLRKIDQYRFLRSDRIFKNARWIDQIYVLHVLDHPAMQQATATRPLKAYGNGNGHHPALPAESPELPKTKATSPLKHRKTPLNGSF
jgi:hypothetical protein